MKYIILNTRVKYIRFANTLTDAEEVINEALLDGLKETETSVHELGVHLEYSIEALNYKVKIEDLDDIPPGHTVSKRSVRKAVKKAKEGKDYIPVDQREVIP